MKILVVCQYYYPEPFRIQDICEQLVRHGHEVTVVTGVPNYPMGVIYDGYRRRQRRDETINGVKVHRCFTVGRRNNIVFRLVNYYSYMLSSCAYTRRLGDEFDVVFVNQLSPVMMAKAGIVYKKKHGKRLVLYCLDLWPESLIAGGIGRNSFIYKYYRRVSEKIYSKADKILAGSALFSQYFEKEFGIPAESIGYLPQYAESMFTPDMCSKKPDGKLDLMFAGNVGSAQSVETIIRAADLCRDTEALRWHIVGDGKSLEGCKALARELNVNSVVFHGRKPVDCMPEYYAMADAMLVTMQADPVLSLTLPGKLQTYMAAGKPIIGAVNGEAAQVIRASGCGFCAAAEDFTALADAVRRFCSSTEKCRFGEKSREYYCEHFDKAQFMKSLENELCR